MDNICPICQLPINKLNNYLITKCNHTFHTDCLLKNTTYTHNNGYLCPCCREQLVDNIQQNQEENFIIQDLPTNTHIIENITNNGVTITDLINAFLYIEYSPTDELTHHPFIHCIVNYSNIINKIEQIIFNFTNENTQLHN